MISGTYVSNGHIRHPLLPTFGFADGDWNRVIIVSTILHLLFNDGSGARTANDTRWCQRLQNKPTCLAAGYRPQHGCTEHLSVKFTAHWYQWIWCHTYSNPSDFDYWLYICHSGFVFRFLFILAFYLDTHRTVKELMTSSDLPACSFPSGAGMCFCGCWVLSPTSFVELVGWLSAS